MLSYLLGALLAFFLGFVWSTWLWALAALFTLGFVIEVIADLRRLLGGGQV